MGHLLLAFSRSCPPPGPLFLLVFGRAFLALCLFLVFSLIPLLLWLLCVVFFCWCFCLRFCGCLLFGICVPPFVLWGFPPLFAVFVVLWAAPLPRWLLSPSPLRLFPCGVLVQLLCWSLPLGIWLLHVTARLPCPNAWGVVVLCFLASSCFMAAKAFGPVWGICVTLYTMVHVLLLCSVLLR